MPTSPVSIFRKFLRLIAFTIAWALTIPALLLSSLWMFSEKSFRVDLIANLGAQILILCIAVAIIDAILRRPRALVFALLACAIQLTPLVEHRAAFLPRAPGPVSAPGAVRFLHYNDSCLSDKVDVYALMERSGADVLSILCPPVQMQFDVIYGHGLEDKYPGKLLREWKPAPDKVSTEISAGFVVSRWPLTRVDCTFVGPMADRFIAGVVERPGGRFAIVAVHPRSPRSELRWNEGNQTVRALITLSRKLQNDGLPVVVLTDLNSSPTGWRSRAACDGGLLRRAKPLLYPDGTYPDVVPLNIRTGQTSSIGAIWPLSIAIDDALISPGITVAAWTAQDRLRSEHRPVIIDLTIPPTPASAPNPIDR